MTYLGLKFLMDKLKFLISKNFSYVFSVAINVFLCYSTNTVMEKNKWEGWWGQGGMGRDMQFSGVLMKQQVDFPGVN